LAACGWTPGEWTPSSGFLGRQVNPRPAPVTLTASGGLHGELVAGSDQSPVPVELVDAVVGTELRRWLSPPERAALAEASQHAAIAERNAKVAWAAQPPDGAAGVVGWASPISDPYRASHGAICRDVRQALTRADDAIVQSVSLCREETGLGGTIWSAAHWP
jgi:surface antigen